MSAIILRRRRHYHIPVSESRKCDVRAFVSVVVRGDKLTAGHVSSDSVRQKYRGCLRGVAVDALTIEIFFRNIDIQAVVFRLRGICLVRNIYP